jgi:hypothetical protein
MAGRQRAGLALLASMAALALATGIARTSVSTGSRDRIAPTMPPGLRVVAATSASLSVSWKPARDNVRVTGYRLYRNGVAIATYGPRRRAFAYTALDCGTTYRLAVQARDAAGNRSRRASILGRTATCPAPTTDVVVAAAGDICTSAKSCAATAALIERLDPVRVLTLGDNAYPDGTFDQFASVYAPSWGRFKDRTSPSPGNHEYHTPGARGYFDYFGPRAPAEYYSFDLGSWHLISLNSEIPLSAGSTQAQWLRADLAAHPSTCILAYWHTPRFSSGSHHGSNSRLAPLWDVLLAGGADLVLNGHEHNYERFAPQDGNGVARPDGIREFVVGTGGASHYPFGTPIANSEARDSTSFGVLELVLRETGYEWEFVPVAGATFTDSGSGSC